MAKTVIRILLALIAIAVLAVVGFFALRRADISDPAVLASMPAGELRDAEVETLIRAAFRSTKRAVLIAEMAGNQPSKQVVVVDRRKLDELADSFFVGQDKIRPMYAHPGVMYAKVKFEGPYQPNFTFLNATEIYILYGGRVAPTPGEFAVKIGDLLGLERAQP